MIIYGYRTSHLRTEPVAGSCPTCATPDSLRVSVLGRYAHVYWVPLFPLGKTGGSECGHCRQVLRPTEMPPALRQEFQTVKQRAGVPLWHFAGAALAALGVLWGVVSNSLSQEANQTFITAPHKGDLYYIRTENGHYSLLKVQEVAGNSVKLLANNYEIDTETGAEELNKPENFAPEPVELTRYDLKIMLNKDEIVEIERQ
ncbi:hypothetical protein [Hymenobacter glacieicola]|uniref:Zinc-ribbon 15 domain-containing protein n=1 Tax=Hymenobacter glacieicola TaxID=1562124 RepID=A0ABQ1WVX5_9BACT|nr:hypothetical protein [Hymenobacter glacieicola]GGG47473.1 hypothetical protein GCM10011378_24560 [Hymenobacter glacieicola]